MSLTFAAAPPRRMGTPARAPRFVDQDDDVDLVATSLGQLRFLPGDENKMNERQLTAAAAAADDEQEKEETLAGDEEEAPAVDDEEQALAANEEEGLAANEEEGLAANEEEGLDANEEDGLAAGEGDDLDAGDEQLDAEEEEEAAVVGGAQGSVGREKGTFDRTACYGALLGNRRKC